ncbi:hypothetical protein [Piscinibacter sp. XHJ-5]|uniref:hypothetical protein n=1 Tax=Piscinibacter sp. XHJ-5 TaxID=3037797 RepID=UPI00245321EE|nr:hypothetical protein [Piscinibacter sp. XHJ-5]
MRPHLVADGALQGAGASQRRPFRERALLILWPSFLMAGVLEMLVFAVVDPGTMHWFGADPIDWSPSAVYSVTFFIFWGAVATSGAITALLEAPVD